MKRLSFRPRPSLATIPGAAALACGLLLAGCGGGGGGGGGGGTTPPTATAQGLSESDATADAANGIQAGDVGAASVDAVFDGTQAMAQAVATSGTLAAARASAQGARPQDGITTTTNVNIACPGGGTATVSISGSTLALESDGQFDTGEVYTVTYSHCTGSTGFVELDGQAVLTVTDVTAAENGATPQSITAAITATNLTVSLPQSTTVVNGSADITRTSLSTSDTTTTTSAITSPSLSIATQFNSRSASLTITGLNATRTAVWTNGQATSSTYGGTCTVTGTADGQALSFTSTTTGSGTSFDATGLPTAGSWTVVTSDATIQAALANGTVVLTVDDGSDGTIDATYTLPALTLDAAAG